MAVVINVEVDESVSERMTILAEHSRFTPAELHRMALERFLDEKIDELQRHLISVKDIQEGRVIPHSAIKAWIGSLGTDAELPAPGAQDFIVKKAS